MSGKQSLMSWWEVAEMVYERRAGWSWEHIGNAHGISSHKAKREVKRFCVMGREAVTCSR